MGRFLGLSPAWVPPLPWTLVQRFIALVRHGPLQPFLHLQPSLAGELQAPCPIRFCEGFYHKLFRKPCLKIFSDPSTVVIHFSYQNSGFFLLFPFLHIIHVLKGIFIAPNNIFHTAVLPGQLFFPLLNFFFFFKQGIYIYSRHLI